MSRLTRVLNVLRRRAVDREFDEELRFHILQRIQQNVQEGMTQAEADADARLRFGDLERVKAGMRAQRIVPWSQLSGAGIAAAVAVIAGAVVFFESPVIYEVGADVSAPVPIYSSKAEYTAAARKAKVQGVVRVACVVRPSGDCSDVAVVDAPVPALGLDDEAMRAVRRWRFRPGRAHGNVVPVRVQLEFTFALR